MFKSLVFKYLILIAPLSALFLVACSEEKEDLQTDEIVVDEDYYEYQDFNLAPYEIDATIKLPDETANIGAATKPEVIHSEGDLYWTLNVGQNFQMTIEDYANFTDVIKEEKQTLEDQKKFFKLKYLVEEDDLIVYERTLVPSGESIASPTVGVEHKSYHVCGQKVVNGITYKLASREEGFEKMIIEIMAKSIRSLQENK